MSCGLVLQRQIICGLVVLLLTVCSEIGLPEYGSPQENPAHARLLEPGSGYWKQQAPPTFRVNVETSKGSFVLEIHRDWAPNGADRFYSLARAGFYDDSRFFRVMRNYIAQFGIPGDPSVAAVWRKVTIPDDPVRQSNLRGFIGYAMLATPNTRTTQLYINLKDNTQLDAQEFAPIGKVIRGMGVVDRLYPGYGEGAGGGMRAGKQGKILEGGNAYLDRAFPLLDKLLRAAIVEPARKERLPEK